MRYVAQERNGVWVVVDEQASDTSPQIVTAATDRFTAERIARMMNELQDALETSAETRKEKRETKEARRSLFRIVRDGDDR